MSVAYAEAGFDTVAVEQAGPVLVVSLDRPAKLNAWTPRMMDDLSRVLELANGDETVGAVVLTGRGRGFCAGADVTDFFAPAAEARESQREQVAVEQDWVSLCRSSKPLVAAVNGAAVGIGLSMVLPFDQILVARGAKLSARFVRMGLVNELGSSHFLVARCGFGAASWLSLSGTMVSADEAVGLRLADRVCEPDQLMAEALACAGAMAENPTPQLRMIKRLLTLNGAETDLDLVQRREGAAMAAAYETPEHREAIDAFVQRRKPVFR